MNNLARLMVAAVLLAACATLGFAQAGAQPQPSPTPQVSPTPPQDRPVSVKAGELQSFEDAIKPAIEKARKSYPEARKRFLDGLPPKHIFYLTTRLFDKEGRVEQVFIAVREIKDGTVKGVIASEIELISGYKAGDPVSFPESDLIDWTIVRPDGSEEGNFVGKFLDEYRPQQ